MKIKVAILEDDKELLKENASLLEETGKVEVVVKDFLSSSFIEKVKSNDIDAIILDIDLAGDTMSGIDVAAVLKKPTIFISGKTKDFIKEIEEINIDSDKPVEHITKPITKNKLDKILDKFIRNLKSWENERFVYLDFKESKRNKIAKKCIVYIESDTGASGESNNKTIYFNNRKKETLYNFSFTKMDEKGITDKTFVKISKSNRVNAEHILQYNPNHTIDVYVFEEGKKQLKVSENYYKDVKRILK